MSLWHIIYTKYIIHVKVQLFVTVKIRIRIRMDPVRIEGESWISIRIETNADPQDCLF